MRSSGITAARGGQQPIVITVTTIPETVSACKATAYSYGKMAFMVQSLFVHTVEDR